jgi:ankyrin repeat protein
MCQYEAGDALRRAARVGDGAKVDTVDKNGITALMWASCRGLIAVVDALLAAGATVDETTSNYGNTALMLASISGHLVVAKRMIDAGASADKAGKDGWTALMYASYKGHNAVVAMLLAAGATVDETDVDGNTALMWARRKGHTAVVETLLAAVEAERWRGVSAHMRAWETEETGLGNPIDMDSSRCPSCGQYKDYACEDIYICMLCD